MSWNKAVYQHCTHAYVEEIRNGNDRLLGGQCKTCLKVMWGIGDCAGCGEANARLALVVDGCRYCNHECQARHLEKAKAGRKVAPPPCDKRAGAMKAA